jgi:hypothetical protein
MHNSTLQNNITIHTVHPSIRIQTVHNEVYNTLLHHIVNTCKKKSMCVVIRLVGMGTTTYGHAIELVRL